MNQHAPRLFYTFLSALTLEEERLLSRLIKQKTYAGMNLGTSAQVTCQKELGEAIAEAYLRMISKDNSLEQRLDSLAIEWVYQIDDEPSKPVPADLLRDLTLAARHVEDAKIAGTSEVVIEVRLLSDLVDEIREYAEV